MQKLSARQKLTVHFKWFGAIHQALLRMQKNGYSPATIFDIGAFDGEFTALASQIWPQAKYHLVEALPEKEPLLQEAVAECSVNGSVHIAVVGKEEREVQFTVMSNASSIYPEVTSFPREVVARQMQFLDSVISGEVAGPALMKLDVQGAELDVLEGCGQILSKVDAVLMETPVMEYNRGAPDIVDAMVWMKAHGFALFDICTFFRRQTDEALCQTDLIFVRKDHPLRMKRKFFNREP